jgi:hypothetical protein
MNRGSSGSLFQTLACEHPVLASVPGMFDFTRPDDMLTTFLGGKPNNEPLSRNSGISR